MDSSQFVPKCVVKIKSTCLLINQRKGEDSANRNGKAKKTNTYESPRKPSKRKTQGPLKKVCSCLIRPKQPFPCRHWYEGSDGRNAIQWKEIQPNLMTTRQLPFLILRSKVYDMIGQFKTNKKPLKRFYLIITAQTLLKYNQSTAPANFFLRLMLYKNLSRRTCACGAGDHQSAIRSWRPIRTPQSRDVTGRRRHVTEIGMRHPCAKLKQYIQPRLKPYEFVWASVCITRGKITRAVNLKPLGGSKTEMHQAYRTSSCFSCSVQPLMQIFSKVM